MQNQKTVIEALAIVNDLLEMRHIISEASEYEEGLYGSDDYDPLINIGGKVVKIICLELGFCNVFYSYKTSLYADNMFKAFLGENNLCPVYPVTINGEYGLSLYVNAKTMWHGEYGDARFALIEQFKTFLINQLASE